MRRFAISRRAARSVLVATGVIVLLLLLVPTRDPSYECGKSPVVLLVHPAAENPDLRRDFFDSGYQCNRDARLRAVAAGFVLAVGASVLAARRQRTDT